MKSRFIMSDVKAVRRSDARVVAIAMPQRVLFAPILIALAAILLLAVAL